MLWVQPHYQVQLGDIILGTRFSLRQYMTKSKFRQYLKRGIFSDRQD